MQNLVLSLASLSNISEEEAAVAQVVRLAAKLKELGENPDMLSD